MRSIRIASIVFALAGSVPLLGLQGCATPAASHAMTVPANAVSNTSVGLRNAVRIEAVVGGQETNPLWTSQVSREAFRKALEDSLANYGYLARQEGGARYALSADLQQLDQPIVGLTFDVKSNVAYRLKGENLDKSIPVSAVGTAGFSDAALGVERLRVANERSVLENIKALLKRLADLVP